MKIAAMRMGGPEGLTEEAEFYVPDDMTEEQWQEEVNRAYRKIPDDYYITVGQKSKDGPQRIPPAWPRDWFIAAVHSMMKKYLIAEAAFSVYFDEFDNTNYALLSDGLKRRMWGVEYMAEIYRGDGLQPPGGMK